MVKKYLVELYIDGYLYTSTMAEETRLRDTVGLYRYMGTTYSEGFLWEIFIIRKSLTHYRKLDDVTQKLFDAAIEKHNTDYGITASDHDKLRPVKRKLKNTRVDLNKV